MKSQRNGALHKDPNLDKNSCYCMDAHVHSVRDHDILSLGTTGKG